MKKITLLLLLTIMTFGLFGCEKTPEIIPVDCDVTPDHEECIVDYLDIYYLNDFHGAILETDDYIGAANIANFLITKQAENPENTIILAGGDMLQGSAMSNYYYGLSTITLMNQMHFDAFGIGNHEFDWGLEVVTNYFDDDETNGEANFPLLGANVFLKGTTTIPDGIEPYTIIERGDYKIGIIGTVAYGLEYAIAGSKIEDYEFAPPVPIIEEYATYLRTEADCDFIILISHDPGTTLNIQASALSGDAKLDAIFNAHSHSDYVSSNMGLPILQAGSNGKLVGYVRLNLENNAVSSFTLENLTYYSNPLLQTPNQTVLDLVNIYKAETDALFNSPLITTDEYLSKTDLSNWISKLMRTATDSDIGFQNSGGTRINVADQTVINNSVLYEIWPFDNVIITAYIKGSDVKTLMKNLISDTTITTFNDDTYYKIATNDYVFDQYKDYFTNVNQITNTGILLRDLAKDEFTLQGNTYPFFYLDNPLLIEHD
ncbi:MAG: bifunctional metallophosphatase/5'-nucleotidase [Bacilli bacterium]|nr:bifunctional metallophosphatase/5'-nucleotidase [Bacilli bacterium]